MNLTHHLPPVEVLLEEARVTDPETGVPWRIPVFLGGDGHIRFRFAPPRPGQYPWEAGGYTLTTFIKPRTLPEPYLAPVPVARLQTMGSFTLLAVDVDEESDMIVLENREGLLEASNITFAFGS